MKPHPLTDAVAPLVAAVGAALVAADEMVDGDLPLEWEGEVIAGVRFAEVASALDRMITQVETELGGSLQDLERGEKQAAVRMLEERGAFELRKSIENVADAMGVSRITIYNYLSAIRDTA